MANVKCDVCNGHKTILCLGNIHRDCYACDGIGYTKEDEDNKDEEQEELRVNKNGIVEDKVVQIKKRGRPRRVETKDAS